MQRTMPREPRRREKSAPCCTSSAVNASARVAAVVTFCLSPPAPYRRRLRARDLSPTDRGPLGASLPCLGRGERRADRLDGARAALQARSGVDHYVDEQIGEALREPFSRLVRRRKIGRAVDDGLVGGRAAPAYAGRD